MRPLFEAAFRRFGLPQAITTDNGPPFASRGVAGLSPLSAWWLKLGIRPQRIEPGQPQQNGRHERMHRTLKAETASPPAATLAGQQRRFDRFVQAYNEERPHEALGQRPPVSLYRRSTRPCPDEAPDPVYPDSFAVRRLSDQGFVNWAGGHIPISKALAGELIGLRETDGGHWLVRFAGLDLGLIDRRDRTFDRRKDLRPEVFANRAKPNLSPTSPV